MSRRLDYTLTAGAGRVLLTWSEPIRWLRLPYPLAFQLAKDLVTCAQRAEVQGGIVVDRTEPERVDSVFNVEGGVVKVNWGVLQAVFDWSPGTTFAIANALVSCGETAQRWYEQGPGLTPREVDRVEEATLGEPVLTKLEAGLDPWPGCPIAVGETYFYRPTSSMGRVLSVDRRDHRADIVLPDGALLRGVVWSDLLDPVAIMRASTRNVANLAIGSTEILGAPSLS